MSSLVIAHRGASGEAPENTLAAFRLAWSQGADGIEMDVRLSGDGEVLVHHDADTRRTGDEALDIASTPAHRLRQLDVGSWKATRFRGEQIPTLWEVLALNPQGLALVELKTGPEIVEPLAGVLEAFPGCPVRLISFHRETLQACREALPAYPSYLITESLIDAGGKPYHSPGLIDEALRLGFQGLDPQYTGIDQGFASAVAEAGLDLFTWTVNDAAAACRLASWNLQGITGNYPDRLLAALGRSVKG